VSKWPIAKLKFISRFGYGDALPSEREFSGSVPVYGSNGPYDTYSEANTHAPVIVIGRKGSYGKVNWSNEPVYASDTTFYIDDRQTKHNIRWLFWLLQTLKLDEGSGEAAVPGLNRETAYDKRVTIPLLHEQAFIASYLDQETEKIDSMIGVKERQLELMDEKRLALITHAVTRGLNPDATFRDSGIPWLGQIPEHWEIERSKWLLPERDERSETGEEEMLTVSHMTGVTPRSDKDVNMFEAESTVGYKLCYAGDLVINTLWAWMGAMGVSPIDGIVSPAYNVYTPSDRMGPAYIDAMVRMPVFAQEVTRYSKGVWTSRLRLYPEGLYEVWLPVPPLEEQKEIVEYINREAGKLDELSNLTRRTIDLLKERRAALITAAVTGQIEVLTA
jgi:type I restriction enzyme S subunit